jgi:phage baseplate assembly protein W
MAYRIENNNPLDVDYKLAVGVKVPFVGSSPNSTLAGSDAVFNSTFTTTEQIRSDLINWMLTNKGERILNPNYGSDLRRFIFQNIDGVNLNTLKAQLLDGIQTNFPQINVKDLTINPYYDTNSINIILTYSFMGGADNNINIRL